MTTEDWLRSLPTLTGTAPTLPGADAAIGTEADDPRQLFLTWVRDAAAAGVPEPHAATLATVDRDGLPDARTLILKDVGARGWAFAGRRSARKRAQLEAHAAAALNFWWQPLARAVRLRGPVVEALAEESAADLAARSPAAREGIDDWVRWWLDPAHVEFWQASPDRRHVRIVYERIPDGWTRREERA